MIHQILTIESDYLERVYGEKNRPQQGHGGGGNTSDGFDPSLVPWSGSSPYYMEGEPMYVNRQFIDGGELPPCQDM